MTNPVPFLATDIANALGGRFTVQQEVRVGGQGVVYRALWTSDRNGGPASDLVALKLHLT